MKLLHIVGARPQFIKLKPLYKIFRINGINQEILHTGQHYDEMMSSSFFKKLDIPEPDYNLKISNLSHGAMTGRMIEKIEKILINSGVDYVIIYGDTNSTLAGAISAKKLGISVVHIESGVRNNDPLMPEEINRVLSDRISDILFCNTQKSVNNLINEGFDSFDCEFYNSGDLMFDCLKNHQEMFQLPDNNNFILVTCHRASNTEKNTLIEIVKSLNKISKEYEIVFPIHPRTKKIIKTLNIKINFKLIEPLDYFKFLGYLSKCKYVITDSGGVVREAFWLKKPSLLLLEKPLWPELVELGVCINTTPTHKEIILNFQKVKNNIYNFKSSIFGKGDSSSIILNTLKKHYDRRL